MSDGGILMSECWGYDHLELRRPITVQTDWLAMLRKARAELLEAIACVLANARWRICEAQTGIAPAQPKMPADVDAFIEGICKGREPFDKGWYYERDKIIDAVNSWNDHVKWTWRYAMGMGEQSPRGTQRHKAGFTKRLTPKAWLKVRGEMRQYTIVASVATTDMWREKVDGLMSFLTEGTLPDGVSMGRNRPKLRLPVAVNVVWYLQQIVGVLDPDEIDVCSDCGRAICTSSQTHDWCPKCSKIRCDGCTTRPDYCDCDNQCATHCVCKKSHDD